MTRTVITSALLYANGPVHIGHMVEYVQTDIQARFLRSLGEDVLYICASDMHGTPIEVKAHQEGISPAKFAQKNHKLNKKTFEKYLINFNNYHHTDSKENEELSIQFFNILKKKGHIHKKEIEVIYCSKCDRSLPDRFVKGTCPNCGAYDQYGDVCESCGLTLKGTDLINPKCTICGKTPVKKKAEHYFFRLKQFEGKLKSWLKKTKLQPEIKNSIQDWINKGLEDWCISRDGPYYGFKIPGEENKYFYVWLDAPIGYISSTKNYCGKKKCNWQDYWKEGKIIHVIGKDIAYFHFLFWPAMLLGADFKAPDDIVVHSFLTVNKHKMSKSRGTFFTAEDFLKYCSPEHLRFYYASHLSKKLSDIDLDFDDFKSTINNQLIANLANFCYRTLSFTNKNYSGKVVETAKEDQLEKNVSQLVEKIKKNYQEFNYKEAVSNILRISDIGNVYFQKSEPWKDPSKSHASVSFCVNLVKNLAILVKPILPKFAEETEKILGLKNLLWKDIGFDFTGKLGKPKILLEKIEKTPEAAVFPLDLEIGKITEVEDHPNADSLYVLKVDFGKEKKQAVAGLKKYFEKDILKGKKAVFCRNIKPAKLRGVESACMILAADDGRNVSLLETENSGLGDKVTPVGFKGVGKQISFDEFLKIEMKTNEGRVFFENKHLKTPGEDVVVKGVRNGALVR